MRKIYSNKKLAAVAVAAVAITGTGVAYAYWTTTGSGSGAADAKTANGTITLHGIFDDGALAPGLSTPVTFTADNTGATDLFVGTIEADSFDATEAANVTGTCDVSDFSMANVTSNTVVPAGSSAYALQGAGSVVFANAYTDAATPVAENQDACKGATITVTLSSN